MSDAAVLKIIDHIAAGRGKGGVFRWSASCGPISQRLMEIMGLFPSREQAETVFQWGIFSADITCVLSSWQFFVAHIGDATARDSALSGNGAPVSTLALNNAVRVPSDLSRGQCMRIDIRATGPSAFLGCDGRAVYVFGDAGRLVTLDMARTHRASHRPVTTVDLQLQNSESVAFITGNDVALLLTSTALEL
jgi:hypothetical protein